MKRYRASWTFVMVDLLFDELLPFVQNSGFFYTTFLDFSSLCSRRARAHTIMLFQIHNRLVDISPEGYFVPTCIQTRGHTIKFLQLQARIQAYQYSFFPCAIRYWNSLPAPVVKIGSVEAFKQSLAAINIIWTISQFLAPPSRRLKWAIIIRVAHRPSSVRP